MFIPTDGKTMRPVSPPGLPCTTYLTTDHLCIDLLRMTICIYEGVPEEIAQSFELDKLRTSRYRNSLFAPKRSSPRHVVCCHAWPGPRPAAEHHNMLFVHCLETVCEQPAQSCCMKVKRLAVELDCISDPSPHTLTRGTYLNCMG